MIRPGKREEGEALRCCCGLLSSTTLLLPIHPTICCSVAEQNELNDPTVSSSKQLQLSTNTREVIMTSLDEYELVTASMVVYSSNFSLHTEGTSCREASKAAQDLHGLTELWQSA